MVRGPRAKKLNVDKRRKSTVPRQDYVRWVRWFWGLVCCGESEKVGSVRRVGRVTARAIIGLLEDRRGLEHVQLIALDLEAFVRKEEVVFVETRSHAADEENRIGFTRVAELNDGTFGPRATVEVQFTTERVETFGRELLERVCPGQPTELDAGSMEMPAVVDVVVGSDDLRQATVRVIVEVDDASCGHSSLVAW